MCHAVANEYDSFEQGAIYDWCVLFYLYVIWLCVCISFSYVVRFCARTCVCMCAGACVVVCVCACASYL